VTLYKRIRAHLKVIADARKESGNKRFKFSVPMFQEIYEALYMGLDRDKGKFRKDIPLHRTYFHDILPPEKIADELDALIEDANSAGFRSLHPIKQASLFGYNFMQVFPWSEASGMIARLMSNTLLMRANYYPAIIHVHDRERYYQTLKQSANSLRDLLTESMESSLENSIKFLQTRLIEERRGRVG